MLPKEHVNEILNNIEDAKYHFINNNVEIIKYSHLYDDVFSIIFSINGDDYYVLYSYNTVIMNNNLWIMYDPHKSVILTSTDEEHDAVEYILKFLFYVGPIYNF